MNTVNFFKKSAIALIIATVAFAGCEKNSEDDPDNSLQYFADMKQAAETDNVK